MEAPRKYIWIGLIVVAVGVYSANEAVGAYRTDTTVHMLHAPDLEWWAALGMAILEILFGFLITAAGLGWVKPRGERPME